MFPMKGPTSHTLAKPKIATTMEQLKAVQIFILNRQSLLKPIPYYLSFDVNNVLATGAN
jgi:hypothetical protein